MDPAIHALLGGRRHPTLSSGLTSPITKPTNPTTITVPNDSIAASEDLVSPTTLQQPSPLERQSTAEPTLDIPIVATVVEPKVSPKDLSISIPQKTTPTLTNPNTSSMNRVTSFPAAKLAKSGSGSPVGVLRLTNTTTPWELPAISPQVRKDFAEWSVDEVNGQSKGSCRHGEEDIDLLACLSQAPHFALLNRHELSSLDVLQRDYCPGEEIVGPGDDPTHVYVVLTGNVLVFTFRKGVHARTGSVEPAGTFGAENVILQRKHSLSFRAGNDLTSLMIIRAQNFVEMLGKNQRVSQSFARNLCDQMSLFNVFQAFCREVFAETATTLDMDSILTTYSKLQSCLHPDLSSKNIDVDAWAYAINRLPENITETFSITLSRSLPPFLAERMRQQLSGGRENSHDNTSDTKLVLTKYRRRCAWQIGFEGAKTLVLLRDGFTDMLDFVTMLCVHMTEAKKLRGRLQGQVSPDVADILDTMLKSPKYYEYVKTHGVEPKDMQQTVLDKLPLSPRERKGIAALWPSTIIRRLHSIIMHREEYLIHLSGGSVSKRFDADPYQQWMLNIREKVMSAIGCDLKDAMPQDIGVHIISSNTYSTKNVLLPFVRLHMDRIIEFGRKQHPDIVKLDWRYTEDMIYALLDKYVAYNALSDEYNRCLEEYGFSVMEDRAATGLAVDVICLWQLDWGKLDSVMYAAGLNSVDASKANRARDIIVNMDFAFGAQADGILRALILLFGQRIKSVNVLGKAGGLMGARGDIQLATHVLLSKSSLANTDATDELRSCDNRDVSPARLKELSGRGVHVGPVLTIPGTILQNVELLRYYRTLWRCVGVEMEGSYFARQVIEGIHIGLLQPNVRMRFAYNTSDLPMQASGESNLSTDLRPDELVPPLYAITRCFVEVIMFGND